MSLQKLKNYLVPTRENGYQPRVLTLKSLSLIMAVFVFYQLAFYFFAPKSSVTASDLTTGNITAAVNRERQMRDLTSLNTDSRLTAAAQAKAVDMMNRHYFSHTNPEGEYIWPSIVAQGYSPYLQLGENLAIEFYDTESLVAAWMNSPTHRANILNENFKDQGMGLAFGNPSSNQYYSAVANAFGALLPKKTPPPSPQVSANTSTSGSTPSSTTSKPTKQQAPTPTPTPAVVVVSSPPAPAVPVVIDKTSLKVEPYLKGTRIMLGVTVNVGGEPDAVVASVGQRATQLTLQDFDATTTQSFIGSVELLPPFANLTLRLVAQDSEGTKDTYDYPLVSIKLPAAPEAQETEPVVSKQPKKPTFYQTNRFITLGFGGILLLLLITDAWSIVEKKAHLLDKKINNLFVLIIALLIIALIYWL